MPGGRPKGSKNRPSVIRTRMLAAMQGVELVKSLQDHVLGKKELEMSQVKAAAVLLARLLPSLQSSEVKMDGKLDYAISSEPKSIEEWEREANYLGAPTRPPETPH